MSNQVNQGQATERKIYLPNTDEPVLVSEEVYHAYYRDIWATHKRAQYHHQCKCREWQLCDGDCLVCQFRAVGDKISLNKNYSNDEGDECSLQDKLEDESGSIEEIVTDKIALGALLKRLDEIMPEARRIGELRLDGLTDAEIAKVIGIPRTTFLSRIKKAAEILRCEYPDIFSFYIYGCTTNGQKYFSISSSKWPPHLQ